MSFLCGGGGLGHNYVEIPDRNFLEQMENYATVFIQNAAAIGMIFEKHFGNASMIIPFVIKIVFEDLLVEGVEVDISLPVVPGGGISNSTAGSLDSGGSGGGRWRYFCIERLQHRRRGTCDKYRKASC